MICILYCQKHLIHTTNISVSFVHCERCSFCNNCGVNSADEYGAAVIIISEKDSRHQDMNL